MDAFHSNWTAPFTVRNPARPYAVEPFELLTTLLSALQWQALGGTITMITDGVGAAYYCAIGLGNLWNGGIRVTLDDIPSISPQIFWAGGKLFALRQMSAPCIMIDTDFIVWQDIAPLCVDADVAVIHCEDIVPEIYPAASHFQITDGLKLSSLDWSVRPCNTALSYFGNAAFKTYYTDRAIDFMQHAPQADNALTYMVFAEQRLLAMCIAEKNACLLQLSDLPELFGGTQKYFTHVWGFKQQMRDDPAVYHAFCHRCCMRLTRDFPAFAEIARKIPSLCVYFVS